MSVIGAVIGVLAGRRVLRALENYLDNSPRPLPHPESKRSDTLDEAQARLEQATAGVEAKGGLPKGLKAILQKPVFDLRELKEARRLIEAAARESESEAGPWISEQQKIRKAPLSRAVDGALGTQLAPQETVPRPTQALERRAAQLELLDALDDRAEHQNLAIIIRTFGTLFEEGLRYLKDQLSPAPVRPADP